MKRFKVKDLSSELKRRGHGIGERRAWALLRRDGWVCKGSTLPTRKSVESGYMVVGTRSVRLPNGIVVPREQTYVTAEGRLFFLQELPRMHSAESEINEKKGGADGR